MAIAYDNSSSSQDASGTATTLTYSHTTTTAANRIILTGAMIDKSTDWVTGITYAGSAMTLVDKITITSGTSHYIYLYYRIAPATGANNVVVSTSNATSIWSATATYTGVLQLGQPDSNGENSAASASVTLSTAVVASGCWLVSTAFGAGTNLTAGTGTTVRTTAEAAYECGIGDSNGVVGTGSQSMGWNGTSPMAGEIVSIKPAPTSGFFTLL